MSDNNKMEIRSLKEVSIETLHEAREDAFRDYPAQWTNAQFERMLARRGYVPELSFGAFDNGKLASYTLNGLGIADGLLTAYDTGTGTLPEYRGRGLAKCVFEETVPHLIKAGVKMYVLEVLQDNDAAIAFILP